MMALRNTRALRVLGLASGLGVVVACASDAGQRPKGGLMPVPGLASGDVLTAAQPRKVALLIGIGHFDDKFWPDLLYTSRDAQELAAALTRANGGDFDEVRTLTTREETSRSRILDEVALLAQRAPRPEDTALIYISSHGTLAPDRSGAFQRVLVTRDTRSDALAASGLPVADLARAFDALPSARKALVLATCHSGSGKSLLPPDTVRAMAGIKGAPPMALEAVSRATLVLSAADFGQAAREDDRLQHDVYTYFLLEALTRRADANGDGAVSATEAHDYARRRTFEYTDGRQVPTVQSTVVGADPVILAGRVERAGLPVLYSYAAGFEGTQVSIDGRDKGAFPGSIVVDQGVQQVELRRGSDVVFDGSFRFEPGARIDVTALIDRAKPRWTAALRYDLFGLLSPALSTQLLSPIGGPSLSLRARDLPWPHLDPLLDLAVAYAEQKVAPAGLAVDQRLVVTRVGVGAAAAFDLWWVRLYGGPHLALIYLDRHLLLPDRDETQRFATVTPGLVAGAALELYWFEAHLEGQLHYLPLLLDAQLQSVATGSIAAGVGVRF